MSHQNNISRIKKVFDGLGDLQQNVVFVGGATVSFYADQQAFEIRETDDVDIIIEVLNYPAYADLDERLRKKGFQNDIQSSVRCRYKIDGITVDIMPTTNVSMGFENIWYPEGFQNAIDYPLDETITIKILSPTYFIATKLEAFKNRGGTDPRQSHDFEDIVYIFENRRAIWHELDQSNEGLKDYLKKEFTKLVSSEDIYEWVDCHVEFWSPPPTDMIIDEIRKFIDNE